MRLFPGLSRFYFGALHGAYIINIYQNGVEAKGESDADQRSWTLDAESRIAGSGCASHVASDTRVKKHRQKISLRAAHVKDLSFRISFSLAPGGRSSASHRPLPPSSIRRSTYAAPPGCSTYGALAPV